MSCLRHTFNPTTRSKNIKTKARPLGEPLPATYPQCVGTGSCRSCAVQCRSRSLLEPGLWTVEPGPPLLCQKIWRRSSNPQAAISSWKWLVAWRVAIKHRAKYAMPVATSEMHEWARARIILLVCLLWNLICYSVYQQCLTPKSISQLLTNLLPNLTNTIQSYQIMLAD